MKVMPTRYPSPTTALAVSSWLAKHDSVITRDEALSLGMTRHQIDRMTTSGEWEIVHRAVYRPASVPVSPRLLLRAASAICGPSAVASHLSAAWLLGMTDRPSAVPTLIVAPGKVVRGAGFRAIRSTHPVRSVYRTGFRCTLPVRTLVDCAGWVASSDLDDLIDRAIARRVVRADALVIETARLAHHPGLRPFERRLAARALTPAPHPSVLESRMGRLLRSAGLPRPEVELAWGPDRRYRLDFAYPELRVVVEVNGWAYHSAPEQARYDAARRNALNQAGWTVLEFDWWVVTHESRRVAAEVAAVLIARAGTVGPEAGSGLRR